MGWIPTREMAFSDSKGKAATFRIQSAVVDPGEGPGGAAPPPLFLDQLRPKGRKKNFKTAHHPPTPLSEGLDPPVVCMDICMYPFRGRASIFNFHYSVKYNGCVTNCVVHTFPFRYSAMIIIWYRIYNLNSYQLCWRQRFFTKKV